MPATSSGPHHCDPDIVLGVACFLYGTLGDSSRCAASSTSAPDSSSPDHRLPSSLTGIIARAPRPWATRLAASAYDPLTGIADPKRRSLVGLHAACWVERHRAVGGLLATSTGRSPRFIPPAARRPQTLWGCRVPCPRLDASTSSASPSSPPLALTLVASKLRQLIGGLILGASFGASIAAPAPSFITRSFFTNVPLGAPVSLYRVVIYCMNFTVALMNGTAPPTTDSPRAGLRAPPFAYCAEAGEKRTKTHSLVVTVGDNC